MHLDNVAMVIAPNLFYNLPRTRDSAMDELTLANHSSHVVKLMLKYQRLLWTVGHGGLAVCAYTHTHTHHALRCQRYTAVQMVSFVLVSSADSRGNAESGAFVV